MYVIKYSIEYLVYTGLYLECGGWAVVREQGVLSLFLPLLSDLLEVGFLKSS